jgi:hypothetical protein
MSFISRKLYIIKIWQDRTDRRGDFKIQLKCRKIDRTDKRESGVRTELGIVG